LSYRLRSLHDELSRSVRSSRRYTIAQAVDDWLGNGMDGRSAATITKYRQVLAPCAEGPREPGAHRSDCRRG